MHHFYIEKKHLPCWSVGKKNLSKGKSSNPPPLKSQMVCPYAHYRRDMIDQLGRHCIACVFVDYFEFSRDWATLGAIFTTTTRNLCVCDVIMKWSIRPNYKSPDFWGNFRNLRISRDFGQYFQGFFVYLSQKKLETWKCFVTSDREGFVCNYWCSLTVSVSGFTHKLLSLAVNEFKMAGVDLKA